MFKTMKPAFVFLFSTLLSISFVYAEDVKDLRGQRYCEVLIAYKRTMPLQVYVYNTIGLNQCPEQIWRSLSTEEIRRDKKAFMVKLNGPRIWVIDGMKNSQLVDKTIVDFNHLSMRAAAILQLKALDLLKGQQPYVQHHVKRNTTWVYKAGRPLYELIDTKGNVYVMQSFSLQKQNLNLHELENLSSSLNLPDGWRFQTRMVNKTAELSPINALATVIQDDLLNTYQLETESFQP